MHLSLCKILCWMSAHITRHIYSHLEAYIIRAWKLPWMPRKGQQRACRFLNAPKFTQATSGYMSVYFTASKSVIDDGFDHIFYEEL